MSPAPDWDRRSAELAARADDPTSWFEELYDEGRRGVVGVPWNRAEPLPLLVEALGRIDVPAGARILVVGAGLGADAEYVARWAGAVRSPEALDDAGVRDTGATPSVTAFDVSPTAVALARERHPDSAVRYEVADLFSPPAGWSRAWDLVVEVITVQALPPRVRGEALGALADLVAPGGSLLVIENVREDHAPESDRPPWPFTRAEMESIRAHGLRVASLERAESASGAGSTVSRWCGVFVREG